MDFGWKSTRQSRDRLPAMASHRSKQARGPGRAYSVIVIGRDSIGLESHGSARHVSHISRSRDSRPRWEMPGPPLGGRGSSQ